MAKKLQRALRASPLSADEANRDAKIREKVEHEFPPAAGSPTPISPTSFSGSLRRAIHDSGKPVEAIAADAELSPILLERFIRGECDIRVATAERLASALGLRFVAVP